MFKRLFILSFAIFLFDFGTAQNVKLTDKSATKETKALYNNLQKNAVKGCLFGHQDDMAYGTFKKPAQGFSDVFDVAGDYPAVYGWDLGRRNDLVNIDSVSFSKMKSWIKEAYERGGVNTISCHMTNFLTQSVTSKANHTQTVKAVLPGGAKHERFKLELDKIADFMKSLKGKNGESIPVIFRPWHQHNGDWFWWGKGSCTEKEYIALWQFTVEYLRDEKEVHNLIYAYSPDRSRMSIDKSEYLYGYPGDKYVDILGLDDYQDVGKSDDSKEIQKKNFVESLKLVIAIAEEKEKIAALTETGDRSLSNPKWFVDILLMPFIKDASLRKIAYVMVWRNAGSDQYYTPYLGHPATEDFLRFKAEPFIQFESELPKMYKSE